MFFGTYSPRLDDKGRLILPAKFRDRLAEGLVVTKGQEHCLYVFPMDEFQRVHEAISLAPTGSKQTRDFIRVLLSGASDELPDKQGRITIPPPLRQYASLDRECTVIGMGNRIEIWATQSWEEYLPQHEEEFSSLAQEVVPGLF